MNVTQIFVFGEDGLRDLHEKKLRPMRMKECGSDCWKNLWKWVRTRSGSRDLLHTDYLSLLMRGWVPWTPCFRYFMQNLLVMQADVEHERPTLEEKGARATMEFRSYWCRKVFDGEDVQRAAWRIPGTYAGLVLWAKKLNEGARFDSHHFMKIYLHELTSYFEPDAESVCERRPRVHDHAKDHCMKDELLDAREHAKNIVVLGAYGICFAEEVETVIDQSIMEGCVALNYDATFLSWFDLETE